MRIDYFPIFLIFLDFCNVERTNRLRNRLDKAQIMRAVHPAAFRFQTGTTWTYQLTRAQDMTWTVLD